MEELLDATFQEPRKKVDLVAVAEVVIEVAEEDQEEEDVVPQEMKFLNLLVKEWNYEDTDI